MTGERLIVAVAALIAHLVLLPLAVNVEASVTSETAIDIILSSKNEV